MELFDKKSEVIDIKLTKFGKELFAQGKFKPAYYFFSDDDILYDSGFVSGSTSSEEQNEIVPRIEEQPHVKSVPMRTEMPFLSVSDSTSNYAPSWKLNVLQGKIEAIKRGTQDTNKNFVDSVLNTRIDMEDAITIIASDGTINPAGYVFEFEEKNVPSRTDMFDIEVSMFVESPNLSNSKFKEGQFVPLNFANMARSEVIDDILVEYPLRHVEYSDDNVERFLDIAIDRKAEEYKPMAVTLADNQKLKIELAGKIYTSQITNKDIEEKC